MAFNLRQTDVAVRQLLGDDQRRDAWVEHLNDHKCTANDHGHEDVDNDVDDDDDFFS